MPSTRWLTVLLVLLSVSSPAIAQTTKNVVGLDPNLPYQAERGEPVTYDVDFRAVITAPCHTKLLRVWVPVPPSDCVQQVTSSGFETFPTDVEPAIASEPVFGNRFAYFEFPNPQGAQIVRHHFTVTTAELRWHVVPEKAGTAARWPSSFDRYLKGDAAIVVNGDVEAQLREILPRPTGGYQDLTAAMNWLNENMVYDHSAASLQANALHALENRRGHCSDFHGLCSAFGRALDYPTRVTYGMATFPKNSPSHCKLEAFLPSYGWVSFDVSETQKLIKKIESSDELTDARKRELVAAARRRLSGGFRDNTWFLQTRGTDYDLAPPASRRVKVVRTLFAEADGEPLPEPDPADVTKREFAWMTAHRFVASCFVKNPFQDWTTLTDESGRD